MAGHGREHRVDLAPHPLAASTSTSTGNGIIAGTMRGTVADDGTDSITGAVC
jgi:hypothetical protein